MSLTEGMSKAGALLSMRWLTVAVLGGDGGLHCTLTIPAVTMWSSEAGPVSALPTGTPSAIERLAPTADCIQPTPGARVGFRLVKTSASRL